MLPNPTAGCKCGSFLILRCAATDACVLCMDVLGGAYLGYLRACPAAVSCKWTCPCLTLTAGGMSLALLAESLLGCNLSVSLLLNLAAWVHRHEVSEPAPGYIGCPALHELRHLGTSSVSANCAASDHYGSPLL
jgi:hypothetical protein